MFSSSFYHKTFKKKQQFCRFKFIESVSYSRNENYKRILVVNTFLLKVSFKYEATEFNGVETVFSTLALHEPRLILAVSFRLLLSATDGHSPKD